MILTLLLLQGPVSAPAETTPTLFPLQGEKTIQIGGRLMLDFGFPSGDSDFDAGTEVRRGRFRMFGDLATNVSYKLEYDWAGGEGSLKDGYLKLKGLGPGSLTVGHQFEPIGLETQTSSLYITFLERSSLSDVLTPGRNTGFQYNDGNDRMTWGAGWFRETDSQGASQDESSAFTGRFVFRPWYQDGGKSMLHLGGSLSVRDVDEDGGGLRFRQRPEYHLGERLVDTRNPTTGADIMSDGVTLAVFEAGWQQGPMHAQLEYAQAEVDGADDSSFTGWSAQFGYFLPGESRGYKTSSGTWQGVKPMSNALDGGMGAWEVAARVSNLDLTESANVADEMETVSVGVNWYLNPNARVMLNYIMSEVGAIEDDIIALRFSFYW
jgi:phosphate-selective porin OprO/OprP